MIIVSMLFQLTPTLLYYHVTPLLIACRRHVIFTQLVRRYATVVLFHEKKQMWHRDMPSLQRYSAISV